MKDEFNKILEKAESKLKTARRDSENGQYDDAISRTYYFPVLSLSSNQQATPTYIIKELTP